VVIEWLLRIGRNKSVHWLYRILLLFYRKCYIQRLHAAQLVSACANCQYLMLSHHYNSPVMEHNCKVFQLKHKQNRLHLHLWHKLMHTIHFCGNDIFMIFIIIGIQPLGRFGQRPEFSQATGMVLLRCILDKFLGIVCHCFPPRLEVPTFTTRCLHVRHNVRDPSGGRGNCERECYPVILPKWRFPRHLGIFYMPQIYNMGPTSLLPHQRKACWGIFCIYDIIHEINKHKIFR